MRPAPAAARRPGSCRGGSTCRRRGSCAARSRSASPGANSGGECQPGAARGSCTRSVSVDLAVAWRAPTGARRAARRRGPLRDPAEVLLDQRARRPRTRSRPRPPGCVRRQVVALEERAHVGDARGLEVGVRADGRPVVAGDPPGTSPRGSPARSARRAGSRTTAGARSARPCAGARAPRSVITSASVARRSASSHRQVSSRFVGPIS